jgi:hypothetical protein
LHNNFTEYCLRTKCRKWKIILNTFEIQWTSKYRTNLVFKWSNMSRCWIVRLSNTIQNRTKLSGFQMVFYYLKTGWFTNLDLLSKENIYLCNGLDWSWPLPIQTFCSVLNGLVIQTATKNPKRMFGNHLSGIGMFTLVCVISLKRAIWQIWLM